MAVQIRSYQDVLDYLYSFIDYSLERVERYGPDAFKLDRMQRFLTHLGQPHLCAPALHIAGTKGKGSVASMIASCLQAAGYRTGLYTSPHLIDFRERIQIDGAPISEADVVKRVARFADVVDQEPSITTYELTTALAFLSFAAQSVQAAVYEVGLGGRLDATNVIDPLVCAITSISLDHTHILGDTLGAIAREKAGIIKPGRPVVIAPQRPPAKEALVEVAVAQQAPLIDSGERVDIEVVGQSLDGQQLRMGYDGREVEVSLPLLGVHQQENAAVAFATLVEADRAGLNVPMDAIALGMARTNWPGRMQLLQRSPTVVIDSAHNVHSIEKLLLSMDQYWADRGQLTVVFGASEDKDASGMLERLASAANRIILTQAGHPRAQEPDRLLQAMPAVGPRGELAPSVPAAVEMGMADLQPNDVLLVTGSLFVVGECLERWDDISSAQRAATFEGDRA